MTPDTGYYINRFDLSNFSHTLPGSLLACVPVGLVMLVTYYLFCRPICYVLPAAHRQVLLPLCPRFPVTVSRWIILSYSLLLGAWTHNFWDSFTHEHGWFVVRISWLQQLVSVPFTTVCRYLFLQEISTFVGFAILLVSYSRWLRRQPSAATFDSGSDTWRYIFWIAVLGVSLLISVPAAVHYTMATPLEGLFFVRSIVFRTAIYLTALVVALALAGATLIYAFRPGIDFA